MKTVEQWIAWLNERLTEHNHLLGNDDSPIEGVATIFGLTTYDSAMDEYFVGKILKVLSVIDHQQNFEFIKVQENLIDYTMVVNLKDIESVLDWGTSVRGAWFGVSKDNPFNPHGDLCTESDKSLTSIVDRGDFSNFVTALTVFVAQPYEAKQNKGI